MDASSGGYGQSGTMTIAADPLERLRTRTSEKWRAYPDDVLPLFVAEMDYPLAEPIAVALKQESISFLPLAARSTR